MDVDAKGADADPFLVDNPLTAADVEVRQPRRELNLASPTRAVPVADDAEGVRTADSLAGAEHGGGHSVVASAMASGAVVVAQVLRRGTDPSERRDVRRPSRGISSHAGRQKVHGITVS